MISRLETMTLMAMDVPMEAVRRQIASGIDLMVHLGRMRDKSRKLLRICEVCGVRRGRASDCRRCTSLRRQKRRKGRFMGSGKKKGDLQNTEKLRVEGLWKSYEEFLKRTF